MSAAADDPARAALPHPAKGVVPDDWPLVGHSRIVAAAPHRWHVQIMGDGPDLLLLHGAGASSHSWREVMPELARQHRVIALDLPGHGFTRTGARGRSGLPAVALDVAALLAHLEAEPRLIVGHSAGSAVALQLARTMAVPPQGVVIINGALENFKGAAGWLFPIMAKALVLNPFAGLLLARGGASMASVRNLVGTSGTELSEEGLRLYQRLISDRKHVEGTLAMMAAWSLEELTRALPEIEVPALFLHGTEDSAVPLAVAERAAGAMPDARLLRLDGVGHIAHEEAPERVLAEIAGFAAARIRD
ncbi:alpha/beta fold hydrolase BchO [Boseongicola sp. H5]|uniref:alpha/beta fold hydrolase BchO n=1 Tax=Boseongicola sp. H5 TaxID=2763261 RepID=UPI001D0A74A0|nr:alpha/beta fold hydrolase BchO [Boseongicola sp. H5]